MAIDAVQPVFREIPAPSAVPQHSLTRRDRELQMEEGQPPMEVASTEQEALRWRTGEDLQEKWRKRQPQQNARGKASPDDAPDGEPEALEEQFQAAPGGPELPEEDETGTLFDDRS